MLVVGGRGLSYTRYLSFIQYKSIGIVCIQSLLFYFKVDWILEVALRTLNSNSGGYLR